MRERAGDNLNRAVSRRATALFMPRPAATRTGTSRFTAAAFVSRNRTGQPWDETGHDGNGTVGANVHLRQTRSVLFRHFRLYRRDGV
jgi:hypothetical protein